jgi:hypothetical protein
MIADPFLRGLPFKYPQRLVRIYSNARERNLLELAISAPRFQHLRERQTVFDKFGAENVSEFTLTGLGDLVQVSPHNPPLIAVAARGLIIAALLASPIPARRGTLINPIQALKKE